MCTRWRRRDSRIPRKRYSCCPGLGFIRLHLRTRLWWIRSQRVVYTRYRRWLARAFYPHEGAFRSLARLHNSYHHTEAVVLIIRDHRATRVYVDVLPETRTVFTSGIISNCKPESQNRRNPFCARTDTAAASLFLWARTLKTPTRFALWTSLDGYLTFSLFVDRSTVGSEMMWETIFI